MADLTIKQGASLQLLASFTNDDDSPYDLTLVGVTGGLVDGYGRVIGPLVMTPTSIAGQMSILQPTDAWPIGIVTADIKLVKGIVIVKTSSFTIAVISSQTP